MIEALVVSNLVLWGLVVALGLTVLALTRQLGLLHERIAPAGALASARGPAVGDVLPERRFPTLAGGELALGGASGRTLLFFLSSSCPVCKSLLPTLRRMAADDRALRLVLASDGPPAEHEDFVTSERLEPAAYVLSRELGLWMEVAKLPWAVLIDADGVVRAKGLVNTREHLESLFEAERLGVGSLQEHLARATGDTAAGDPTPLRVASGGGA